MATNPTPKGDKPSDEFTRRQMDKYLSKISGPLIDRIDIHVEVPKVPYRELAGKERGTDSVTMRRQVLKTRDVQWKRNGGPLIPNAVLTGRALDKHAALDANGQQLLKQAMSELGLSARAYDKVRRVARTIADIEGSERVVVQHVAEAIQYRLLDRRM